MEPEIETHILRLRAKPPFEKELEFWRAATSLSCAPCDVLIGNVFKDGEDYCIRVRGTEQNRLKFERMVVRCYFPHYHAPEREIVGEKTHWLPNGTLSRRYRDDTMHPSRFYKK